MINATDRIAMQLGRAIIEIENLRDKLNYVESLLDESSKNLEKYQNSKEVSDKK